MERTNLWLTAEEAARILGLSPFTIRRLLRQGKLPGRKVGKRQWRIMRADLDEYLGAPGKSSMSVQPQETHQAPQVTEQIARLAAEQGVLPVDDFDRLLGVSWSEGEERNKDDAGDSVEEFLTPIRQLRENSPTKSAT